MSAILYFLARKLLPPETEAVEGGSEAIKKALAELGPTTGKEKRLIGISLLLLLFWSTGGKLHSIDTTSVTLAGLAVALHRCNELERGRKTCAVGHVAYVWYWYQPGVHAA